MNEELAPKRAAESAVLLALPMEVGDANLMGTNLEYIQRHLPHFEQLLASDAEQVVKASDAVVVTYRSPQFRTALERAEKGKIVIDLVGMFDGPAPDHIEYRAVF